MIMAGGNHLSNAACLTHAFFKSVAKKAAISISRVQRLERHIPLV